MHGYKRHLAVASAAWMMAASIQAQPGEPPGDAVMTRQETELYWSLQSLAAYSADACGPSYDQETQSKTAELEARLFDQAADRVAAGLNAASAPGSPGQRAAATLRKLETMSAEANSAWRQEGRFHFEVLDLPPAVLVKMSIRAHETFAVFVPEEQGGRPGDGWRKVGWDDSSLNHRSAQKSLELIPLHRGPSGHARFLAKFSFSGCAGPIGVAYYAYELGTQPDRVDTFINQPGVFGLDDKVAGFPRIGELRTEGTQITLPYCWFSGIDTWDNPSLCAVDTYDLFGDEVRFVSRIYNRPDLVPVAKAIEFAQNRDLGALLGYCTSASVAQRMIQVMPPFVFADATLQVTPKGAGKEQVEMGSAPAYRFDVVKHGDRWRVAAFTVE